MNKKWEYIRGQYMREDGVKGVVKKGGKGKVFSGDLYIWTFTGINIEHLISPSVQWWVFGYLTVISQVGNVDGLFDCFNNYVTHLCSLVPEANDKPIITGLNYIFLREISLLSILILILFKVLFTKYYSKLLGSTLCVFPCFYNS